MGVVAYCGVAVLAHIFTPTKWERILWLPMVVIMFITGLLVATATQSRIVSGARGIFR
jgi:hypothetical protein